MAKKSSFEKKIWRFLKRHKGFSLGCLATLGLIYWIYPYQLDSLFGAIFCLVVAYVGLRWILGKGLL